MTPSPTVAFFPEGAFGPTNNCVGIASVLRSRGHRVVFVVEESFAGTLEAKGFQEARMRLTPEPEVEEEPGQYWKDFIRDTAPQFRRPTIEQLDGLILPIWQGLIDGAKYVEPRLREIFGDLHPDAIVQDNVVAFPAVLTASVPWVRIVSCTPLELKDPALPPTFSGYPAGDSSRWEGFRRRYAETHTETWRDFDAFCLEQGAPGLPSLEFMAESPWLNLYLYPEEADYRRAVSPGPSWHRLESCVRDTDEPYQIPSTAGSDGALIYLSLGSLGSADVGLMQRLIDLLGTTQHRVIVSMGPQHAELKRTDNTVGQEFLPQASILPQVDLVITHGGNNTVTECFRRGKPIIALPLFWDQYDNAQRVDELGFGLRLRSYEFEDRELLDGIERLLGDEQLRRRLDAIATRLAGVPGTVRAADLIEELVRSSS